MPTGGNLVLLKSNMSAGVPGAHTGESELVQNGGDTLVCGINPEPGPYPQRRDPTQFGNECQGICIAGRPRVSEMVLGKESNDHLIGGETQTGNRGCGPHREPRGRLSPNTSDDCLVQFSSVHSVFTLPGDMNGYI